VNEQNDGQLGIPFVNDKNVMAQQREVFTASAPLLSADISLFIARGIHWRLSKKGVQILNIVELDVQFNFGFNRPYWILEKAIGTFMKNIPTQKRAQQKMLALIDASRQSFIEIGYDNTTAKVIAARAGVATGTFYQYFDNKDDILRVIAEQRMADLAEQIPANEAKMASLERDSSRSRPTELLFLQVLTLIYDFHEESPELHQVLEQRRGMDSELNEILEKGEALLEQKVRVFVQSFNVQTPEVVAFNLFAMAEGLVHRHVFGCSTIPKNEVLLSGAKMLAACLKLP
jgi:AcrR family transcriptional regulator